MLMCMTATPAPVLLLLLVPFDCALTVSSAITDLLGQCSGETALGGQDLPRTYCARHKLKQTVAVGNVVVSPRCYYFVVSVVQPL